MTDISYSRADRERVRRIPDALVAQDFAMSRQADETL